MQTAVKVRHANLSKLPTNLKLSIEFDATTDFIANVTPKHMEEHTLVSFTGA
jgi:hypothetical protein